MGIKSILRMINTTNASVSNKPGSKRAAQACGVCASDPTGETHPDHSRILPRLKRAQGQITGVERMISERRYCVDILTQLRAVRAALDAVEANVLENHIRSCVKDAIGSRSTRTSEKKIEELVKLFLRQS
jgi:CsoR family transcriptional regulator, copper-sensing transcriptional repressor